MHEPRDTCERQQEAPLVTGRERIIHSVDKSQTGAMISNNNTTSASAYKRSSNNSDTISTVGQSDATSQVNACIGVDREGLVIEVSKKRLKRGQEVANANANECRQMRSSFIESRAPFAPLLSKSALPDSQQTTTTTSRQLKRAQIQSNERIQGAGSSKLLALERSEYLSSNLNCSMIESSSGSVPVSNKLSTAIENKLEVENFRAKSLLFESSKSYSIAIETGGDGNFSCNKSIRKSICGCRSSKSWSYVKTNLDDTRIIENNSRSESVSKTIKDFVDHFCSIKRLNNIHNENSKNDYLRHNRVVDLEKVEFYSHKLRSCYNNHIYSSVSFQTALNIKLIEPFIGKDSYETCLIKKRKQLDTCKLSKRNETFGTRLISSSSSNNISSNSNNNMESRGNIAKNKYIIEDKLRKQQQQHEVKCSSRLDDRRSTYCSSVGAELNYEDSSFSSINNCSESNNTSAMLPQGSRDSGVDGEEKSNDCNQHPSSNRSNTTTVSKRNKSVKKQRDNWDKNIEFLLAVIGFAVDLGNVWRFPYICYRNGGGAFLIPYTIMFILGGLPIFYLEMSLGQYFSSGCLTVWRRVCPMAKGIGYAMCVLNFFTGLYYNTIISWAVFFFVESFNENLPWTSCNNNWNSNDCKTIDQRQIYKSNYTILKQDSSDGVVHFSSPTKDYFEREVLKVHLSNGIDDLGSIRKPLAIYLAIVFICIYFAIWKGVKSTGKAVWITALLPYFVLIPLLVRGVFLEGAWLGIKYYLYPQWEKIVDVDVWVEAAKQIYFSLGPGFGTLMALSSYNKFNHNCRRDALIAASVNYFASFISGLVIFAVLGYMATIENVNISDVATEGPGLVFQVYPEGLATMRFSSIWSVLFFIMVITLGIDSTFGGLESVITGLCDEYPRTLGAHRGVFIGLLIILIYLCSLPTTTYGGNYVIYVLESYGTSLSLLFIVLIETIIVCWLYGADKFCKNLEEMYGEMPGAYWRICWKYISPTILLLIFCAACGQELDKYHTLTNGDYIYPSWAPTVGLLMTGSSVCCIPIYAIYYLKTKTSGSFIERLRIASRPIEGNQKIYVDAKSDKIRDENDTQLDTVI